MVTGGERGEDLTADLCSVKGGIVIVPLDHFYVVVMPEHHVIIQPHIAGILRAWSTPSNSTRHAVSCSKYMPIHQKWACWRKKADWWGTQTLVLS